MIELNEAKVLASNYVSSKPALADGYRLTIGKSHAVEYGWYFDYKIVCDLDIPVTEQEKFAGSFGFVVDKNTSLISEIGYHDWVDLGLAFHDDPYGDE